MENKTEIQQITMHYNMGFFTYNEYLHLIADVTKNRELLVAIDDVLESDKADDIRREYHAQLDALLMSDKKIDNILKDIK